MCSGLGGGSIIVFIRSLIVRLAYIRDPTDERTVKVKVRNIQLQRVRPGIRAASALRFRVRRRAKATETRVLRRPCADLSVRAWDTLLRSVPPGLEEWKAVPIRLKNGVRLSVRNVQGPQTGNPRFRLNKSLVQARKNRESGRRRERRQLLPPHFLRKRCQESRSSDFSGPRHSLCYGVHRRGNEKADN